MSSGNVKLILKITKLSYSMGKKMKRPSKIVKRDINPSLENMVMNYLSFRIGKLRRIVPWDDDIVWIDQNNEDIFSCDINDN